MADEEKTKLAPQSRSPAYPYISLDLALDRVKRIHTEIREYAQPREVVAKAYGKPATSSATIQTFATLLQYGLLENIAGPAGRKMRVSVLAQEILNPHAPQAKVREGLKIAALNPPIFAELWSRFGDTAGLNESVPLYYLTAERGHEHGGVFTDKAAHEVLRVYRATLSFAGISGDANSQTAKSDTGEQAPTVKVGDFVQVEINGSYQFNQPKRVEAIKEHEGKPWVFLEGEKTAVELSSVVAHVPSEQPSQLIGGNHSDQSPERIDYSSLDWSEESLIDDGGDEIKIRYRGKATLARYEFIRDYLDFKIQRLSKKQS